MSNIIIIIIIIYYKRVNIYNKLKLRYFKRSQREENNKGDKGNANGRR